MRQEYDRMNPDERLFQRLEEYSKITYGAKAYELSVAEATYLLRLKQSKKFFIDLMERLLILTRGSS